MAERQGGLQIDEESLRQWILKAYHEQRTGGQTDREVLDALRQFLSGPIGGPSVPGQYYFEVNPEKSLWRFLGALESTAKGLPSMVLEPLLSTLDDKERARDTELAPNLSVYVASVAGPIAVKSELDETLTCGLVAAALLGLSRLGKEEVVKALEKAARLRGEV